MKRGLLYAFALVVSGAHYSRQRKYDPCSSGFGQKIIRILAEPYLS